MNKASLKVCNQDLVMQQITFFSFSNVKFS